MEPLENGQIQPLGLSHAIGPPGWRPYFQRGILSILKRFFGGHFVWRPQPPWPLAAPAPGPLWPPWLGGEGISVLWGLLALAPPPQPPLAPDPGP